MSTRVSSQRLIGREAELAALEAALADAANEQPSVAFLAGESGVGKTRLLAELERKAREDDVLVLTGDCVDLGESELPYVPLVSALRPLARSGDEALTDPVRAAARAAAPRPRVSTRRRPGSTRRGCSRRLLSLLDALGREQPRAAGHRGPALGRPLDAGVRSRFLARSLTTSACSSSAPTGPTSCTAATRSARCSPSSSATRAPTAWRSSR